MKKTVVRPDSEAHFSGHSLLGNYGSLLGRFNCSLWWRFSELPARLTCAETGLALARVCFCWWRICGYCRRFATGRVDADGIYYRRYFREKTLAWPEIRQAQWRGGRIILLLQGRFPGRRLDFHLNPFTSVVPLLKTPRRRGDVLAAGP